jgi:O-succinylbenzoate synthase
MTAAGLPSRSACLDGLEALELIRVRLPMRGPFVSGHGAESVRDVVLVRALGSGGSEGWAECSALAAPTYTGEYTAGAWAVLRDHLGPAALAGRFDVVVGHPMAAAAIELALADRWLRGADRSLLDACGVAVDERLGLGWTAVLGVQTDIDGLLEAAGSGSRSGSP